MAIYANWTVEDAIGFIYNNFSNRMISAPGNPYGSQCAALLQRLQHEMGFPIFRANAIDWLSRAQADPERYTVIYNAYGVNPQRGDWVVYDTGNAYGHIGLVTDGFDGTKLETLEANVDGGANYLEIGGPVRHKLRNVNGYYTGGMRIVGWIRPNYAPVKRTSSPATQSSQVTKLKDERGTMRVTVNTLNVRNKPDLSSSVVATYSRGQTLNYDSVYLASGYVWVSYVSSSGVRRYVAAGVAKNGRRDPNNSYGTFY